MTCIVAIKHNGTIYMGADSAGSEVGGIAIRTRSDEKVFVADGFIIGFAGSFRLGQLLRYSLTVPEQSSKQDDMLFMVDTFIDSIRYMLREKGVLSKESETEYQCGEFIVGYRGNIYMIEGDFQVACPIEDYMAAGSGDQAALGALYATEDMGIEPENRIRIALEAAQEYSLGVREPFNILKFENSSVNQTATTQET